MSLPACLTQFRAPELLSATPARLEVILHGVGQWAGAKGVRVYLLNDMSVLDLLSGHPPAQDLPTHKRIWIDRSILALLQNMPQVRVTTLQETDEVPT